MELFLYILFSSLFAALIYRWTRAWGYQESYAFGAAAASFVIGPVIPAIVLLFVGRKT